MISFLACVILASVAADAPSASGTPFGQAGAFARLKYRCYSVSLRPTYPIRSEKNHEDDRFSFLVIHSSSVFFSSSSFELSSMGKQISPCFFVAKETNNCHRKLSIKQRSYTKQ